MSEIINLGGAVGPEGPEGPQGEPGATGPAGAVAVAENNAGNSGAALTVSFATYPNQLVTLTDDCTFTFSNPTNGAIYLIRLVQGGSGSYEATWPNTVKWAGGSPPTLSTSVGAIDIVTFYWNGTNYFGNVSTGYA